MPKFTITVELESLGELARFEQAMRQTFSSVKGEVQPIGVRAEAAAPAKPETPKATVAPTPDPKPETPKATVAPTPAPTPVPTAAPSPQPDANGLVLTAGTPYEKSGLPGLLTKAVANDRAGVIALLASLGAKRGGEVTPKDWPALAEGLNAIIMAGPKA